MRTERNREERLLDRLFDRLLDMPASQRGPRLARIADSRPELATRLRRLLDLAEEETPTGGRVGALRMDLLESWLEDEVPKLRAGEKFCGFQIESLVGTGGTSHVYRARRDYEGFATTVALKLIHRSSMGSLASHILRHEQRALALLEHPGIARFIDAGEGPRGELYLAMEYVDGEAILDYADRVKLGVSARVELVIALCRALEHAHARRLVHGDVKSANVLVDKEQRLRLVDFGISSNAGIEAGGSVRAFTPECAAPEQLAGEGITTATDVFQVGALTYRLLVGQSRLLGEVSTGSGTKFATAPSSMVACMDPDVADDFARKRGMPRGNSLRRALSGDLDAVVLRCLQIDPENRYPNATELREDLESWVNGRCIGARPRTVRIRLGKFLLRNVRAACVVALVLIVTVSLSAISLIRLREAELERLAEADRAIQVEQFLSETFRAASPYLSDGSDDPLLTIATLGMSLLEEDSSLDARSRARLGLSLAQLQLARGNPDQASKILRSVESALHGRAGKVAALRAELIAAQAAAEADTDRNTAAIALQRSAVSELKLAGESPSRIALAKGHLGDLLRREGSMDEAGIAFAESIPVILADMTNAGTEQIRVIDRYVRFLGQRDRLDELRALRARIEKRIRHTERRGLAEAELSSVLAEIDSSLTDPALAASQFEDTAARFETLLGADHPRVARSLVDACVSRLGSGEFDRARTLCLRGEDIYHTMGRADSLNSAIVTMNLASIAYNSGLLVEANRYAIRASELFERHEQPYTQLHGQLLLGRIAAAGGRSSRALAHLGNARDIADRFHLDSDSTMLQIGQQQAFALVDAGRLDEAVEVLDSIFPLLESMLPADRARDRVWNDVARARLAGASGDGSRLEAAIASALVGHAEMPGPNKLERAWILGELAEAAFCAGRQKRAIELADMALTLMTMDSAGVHWANAWAVRRLAGAKGDREIDARVRELFRMELVETSLSKSYLSMP